MEHPQLHTSWLRFAFPAVSAVFGWLFTSNWLVLFAVALGLTSVLASVPAQALTLADMVNSVEQAKKANTPRILNSTMLPRGSATQLAHWQQAFGTWEVEQAQLQRCLNDKNQCPLQLIQWRNMMQRADKQGFTAKLATVQGFFNQWRYVKDRREQWATPVASLLKQRGDCEDIVFAKYMSLQLLGIEEDRLRVVAARDAETGKMHALLAVDTHLMDNEGPVSFSGSFGGGIGMQRYTPRYSFNRHQKWLHVQQVAMVE